MSGDHVNQAAQLGATLQSMGVTGGGEGAISTAIFKSSRHAEMEQIIGPRDVNTPAGGDSVMSAQGQGWER